MNDSEYWLSSMAEQTVIYRHFQKSFGEFIAVVSHPYRRGIHAIPAQPFSKYLYFQRKCQDRTNISLNRIIVSVEYLHHGKTKRLRLLSSLQNVEMIRFGHQSSEWLTVLAATASNEGGGWAEQDKR